MATFMLEVQPITSRDEPVVEVARRAAGLEAELRRVLASVGATAVSVSWAHEEGETAAMVRYDASHLVDAGIRYSLCSPGSPLTLQRTHRLFTSGDFAAHMEVATEVRVA